MPFNITWMKPMPQLGMKKVLIYGEKMSVGSYTVEKIVQGPGVKCFQNGYEKNCLEVLFVFKRRLATGKHLALPKKRSVLIFLQSSADYNLLSIFAGCFRVVRLILDRQSICPWSSVTRRYDFAHAHDASTASPNQNASCVVCDRARILAIRMHDICDGNTV